MWLASAALTAFALLARSGNLPPAPLGWFVQFSGPAWNYAPLVEDIPRERSNGATFLHLGKDGTALQLSVTVLERTASRTPRPVLSAGDGFVLSAGSWRRGPDGSIEVDLAVRSHEKIMGDIAVGRRTVVSATLHGRHLLIEGGALVPIESAYPADAADLRDQLGRYCCSGKSHDAACRSIRRDTRN